MGNKPSKANTYYLMMDTEVFDRHGNFKGRFYKDLEYYNNKDSYLG